MSTPSLTDWLYDPDTFQSPDPDAQVAHAAGYFVASVMTDRDSGMTISVWTHSIPTALPKTDYVSLLDNEEETQAAMFTGQLKNAPILVPWAVLAQHLGDRLQQHGTRYYVNPEDFPHKATRTTLERPILRRLDKHSLQSTAAKRLLPRIVREPDVEAKARELGALPVVLLVDPTEEFDWMHLETAPIRIDLREQVVVVLLGRVEKRIVYTAAPWARLVPTN